MIRRLSHALAALSLLLLAAPTPTPAAAQGVQADPTSTLVEGLVVNARDPGPAWWRVSKCDALVYVMGVPAMTPKEATFPDGLLKRRLANADRVILAQEAGVGVFALMRFMAGLKHFPPPRPLSQMLPPPTAARLHAALIKQGDKPDELDDMRPALAGWKLSNDAGGDVSIHLGGLDDRLRDMAKASPKHPRIVSTGKYDVLSQLMALNGLPEAQQLDCLNDGLRTAEAGGGSGADVFRNWAEGRVREVVQADRGFEACLYRSPNGARDVRRRMSVSVDAIKDALRSGGRTVAFVELRPLLAEGGVLDQLRRAGFEVRSPGEVS